MPHLPGGQRSSIAFMISSAHRTASANRADSRRNSVPAVELSQPAGSKDTCRDQQHALAGLVHTGQFTIFRFLFANVGLGSNHRCEITGVKFWAGFLSD
jgi:hypothetical protein